MSHADTCRPRLYVYDLPARYRDDREGGFGKPYNHTSNPTGVQLWQTAEFALGDLLLHRATAYRCRTTDAQSADLFFVPAYSSRQHNRPTERLAEGGNLRALHSRLRKVQVNRCSMLALNGGPTGGAIRGNCSALEARGGADHILINPRNGAPYESHPYAELDYLDPRFGNATLLDLMEPGAWTTRWPGDYKPEARYHSIPHPSLIHLDPAISHLPWRSTHPRGVLVAGAFGVAHGSKAIIGLRTALQRACLASPDGVCRFHKLGDKVAARAGGGGSHWHRLDSILGPWPSSSCIQHELQRNCVASRRFYRWCRPRFHRPAPPCGSCRAWLALDCAAVLERDVLHAPAGRCRLAEGHHRLFAAGLHPSSLPRGPSGAVAVALGAVAGRLERATRYAGDHSAEARPHRRTPKHPGCAGAAHAVHDCRPCPRPAVRRSRHRQPACDPARDAAS